jgi:plasmid stabilization system protein ParE
MKIVILPSAMDDLAEGFLFYENQQEDLGDYFLDSIFADIDSLNVYGGIHRKVFGFHRLLAKRFPYGIYYEIEGNEIRVRAVLDCRRDPKWIRQRLK